uniref:CASP-like protein n=1 Tax=Davidia involucrata TaxID=16924 RepID=A0A5B7BJ14_DAVIN
MENKEKQQTISDATSPPHATAKSSPTRSDNHIEDSKPPSPPAKLPADSPARSSISSDQSSLSHGFSPGEEKVPQASPPRNVPAKPPSPQTVVNRSVRDEPMAVTKANPGLGGGLTLTGGVVEEEGGGRRLRPSLSILRRTKRESMVKKAGLGFRVCGMVFCLVSFAVMAADRNQGWALDSFDRYKEFRYCMSVNVIGFVYSGAQAYYMAYHLATGNYVSRHALRYYLDFSLDQIMTYLVISASSSAATRVDDWQSNWGKDEFPLMATASVVMSFLAFVALASSSLISGYALCSFKST